MDYLEEYKEIHNSWRTLHDKVRGKEYKIFLSAVRDKSSVLEVGLGEGIITDKLVEDFSKKIFLDIDENIINNLRDKHKNENILFINSKLEHIGQYQKDIKGVSNIFIGHTLEHLENPVRDLSRLVRAVSNDDAIYYISVPNALSVHRIAGTKMGLLQSEYDLTEQDKALGHFRNYDLRSLCEDVERSGLKIFSKGGILLKPLSNADMEKKLSEDALNAFVEMGNLMPEYSGEIYVLAKNVKKRIGDNHGK